MQVHRTHRRAKEPWVKHSKLKVSLGNHRPRENFHIPSDLVVDQWVSNVESSSPRDVLFLHDLWTTFRHLLWP
ncbi:MAG: hypothetical protein M3361_02400, partial [Candidatus Tectomicrobia bacterium]|nr:hypothetical protein [Candidatus Tectomicrobia bacterium]